MPRWLDDHLPCAPLGAWLPAWIDTLALGRVDAPGSSAPRALEQLLPPAGVKPTGVLHVGALHRPPAELRELFTAHGAATTTTAEDARSVLVDVAWVDGFAGWFALRPWRRAVARRNTAGRIVWVLALGLGDVQQWVTEAPLPCVVTVGRARGPLS